MIGESSDKKVPRTENLEKCPVCDSREMKFFFSAPDRLHGIPGEYSYYSCRKCQTIFQNPMVVPEDLPLCYPQTYYTHFDISNGQNVINPSQLLRNLSGSFKDRLRKSVADAIMGKEAENFVGSLGNLLAKSRVFRERAYFGTIIDELLPRKESMSKALEIGSGSGDLLVKLSSVGWEVEGVEWDAKAAAVAERKSSCRVRVGDFRQLGLAKDSYDLIVLHHVFEHLYDPVEKLEAMKKLLAPDGRIVLIFPNRFSLGAKVFKTTWLNWDPPRHLMFITPETIRKIGQKLKLKVTMRTKADMADFYSASSRRFGRGLTVSAEEDFRDFYDSTFKKTENLLISIGFAVGDEIVVTLKKGR